MRLEVRYVTTMESFVEVDEKFRKLLDDDWYYYNQKEAEALEDELEDTMLKKISPRSKIQFAWTEDDHVIWQS